MNWYFWFSELLMTLKAAHLHVSSNIYIFIKFGQPTSQEEIDLTITNDIIILRLGRAT